MQFFVSCRWATHVVCSFDGAQFPFTVWIDASLGEHALCNLVVLHCFVCQCTHERHIPGHYHYSCKDQSRLTSGSVIARQSLQSLCRLPHVFRPPVTGPRSSDALITVYVLFYMDTLLQVRASIYAGDCSRVGHKAERCGGRLITRQSFMTLFCSGEGRRLSPFLNTFSLKKCHFGVFSLDPLAPSRNCTSECGCWLTCRKRPFSYQHCRLPLISLHPLSLAHTQPLLHVKIYQI